MQEAKNKIKEYLDKRAAEDELFAKSYAKEKKSLDECISFIMGEAAKAAVSMPGGRGAFMTDEWVYGQAVHYYDEDDIKVSSVRGMATVSTSESSKTQEEVDEAPAGKVPEVKVRITKQDRERAKKEAMERIIEEERKKMLTPRKKQRQEAELSTQMSLFE